MDGDLDEMAVAHAAFQGMRQPLLVIDGQCGQLMCNPAAQALLARDDLLVERGGRIACADPESGRRLERALREVLGGHAPSRAVQLTSTASGDDTSASIRALSGFPPGRPMALLTLFHAEAPADADALACAFALTPAEARIAAQLMRGLTAKVIAQQLGVAVSTVRSHTRDLFDKTGAHRQADLVRRLLLASL